MPSSRATRPRAAPRTKPAFAVRHERALVASLLIVHALLVGWAIARNSVTFDENFHVPAGYQLVTRGDLTVSAVNPPLVKALFGLAVRAAGARPPAVAAGEAHDQMAVGLAFMRANADRYHRVFAAARGVTLLLSLALALLIWRFARRLGGVAGGLLSLGLYATAPEALAHGGVATMDVATALVWLLAVWALWGFARSGRWSWWAVLGAAVALGSLVRFSALLLAPVMLGLAIVATATGRARRPRRLWLGLALLVPVAWLALQAGYLGHTSLRPLAHWELESRPLLWLKAHRPALRLPLPDDWLRGLDHQIKHSEPGSLATYLFGRITSGSLWYYFPVALALKWPVGFMGMILARAWVSLRRRGPARVRRADPWLLAPPAFLLATAMLSGGLNAGVRYMLPVLPFMAVWCAGAMGQPAQGRGGRRPAGGFDALLVWTLALAQPLEAARSLPYPLAFFNVFAGGPGRGERLLNDSNVDWGQGLIALRDELHRRGVGRVHLAYHGTTDPAIYGLDYVPYVGGPPGPGSDWLAVSSYFFVGLPARMVTRAGYSEDVYVLDFRPLWGREPVARPARCMLLFRIR
jgi:hypothetical protein